MKIYAAYGSNMNLRQMKHRCPKAKVIGKGILKDYKLTFRGTYRGVANIERCKGAEVPIVLWEITPACEKELDIYEGFPTLYLKTEITVITEHGRQKAMAYVMAKEYEDYPAEPAPQYYNTILRGYVDNNIPFNILQQALEDNLKELKKLYK